MGRTKTELVRDLEYLLKLWQSIEKNMADSQAPILLHREHDLVIRSIREHYSPEISEILVDDKEVFKKVREFFHQVMPKYEKLVKLYQEKRPLFNKYQLEEQIEQVYSKRIKLKSGGHIIIEPTEAMVTIDVNSGGATKEKDIEETAFKVNVEAAPEVARQLRLRDLGGIIVVDFIDMSQKKHRQEVEKALKAELKRDRAKTKVLRISALGLVELSRQRLKSSLGTGEYLDCPVCDGSGKVRSPEMTAVSVFRKIKSQIVRRDASEVKATVPIKVAEYLLNSMRGQLFELESQYCARITVLAERHISDKEITVSAAKEEIPEPPEAIAIKLPLEESMARADEEASATDEEKSSKTSPRRRHRSKKKRGNAQQEEILEETLQGADINQQPLSSETVQVDHLEMSGVAEPLKETDSGRETGPSATEKNKGSENPNFEDTFRNDAPKPFEESNSDSANASERRPSDSEKEIQEENDQTSPTQTSNDVDREKRSPDRKSFLRTYLPFFQ
jgi:ribonuclease E